MFSKTAIFAALALAGTHVAAQEHSLAFKAGALGLGVEYAHGLGERLGLRVGLNGGSFGFEAEESGIDYDFDFDWDSLSLAVDFHPTRGAFRLTGGLLRNDNGLSAESRPSESIDVGGNLYTPEEVGSLRAAVAFDDVAPFVGVGWDWSRGNRRFGMSFDIGLVKQGEPRVSLSATGIALTEDIERERAELEASLDDFDLLPFGTVGFVFRF